MAANDCRQRSHLSAYGEPPRAPETMSAKCSPAHTSGAETNSASMAGSSKWTGDDIDSSIRRSIILYSFQIVAFCGVGAGRCTPRAIRPGPIHGALCGLEKMVAIPLPPLLLNSLVVSAVLIFLNGRGVGVAGSGAATIATSVVLVVVQWLALGAAGAFRQLLQQWLLFVLVPSGAILAVSRFGSLVGRPWLLLFLGPIVFVLALVLVMITVNLWSGVSQSP